MVLTILETDKEAKIMKKTYFAPEIDVILSPKEDILTNSVLDNLGVVKDECDYAYWDKRSIS